MSAFFHIVIPSRLASQRLPDKPLLDIAGQSLIERVYRRALQADARSVVIATDAEAIRKEAEGFGAIVVMTSDSHESGSDRIAECARSMGWDDDTILVNLQGDEPLMPAECLEQAADLLADHPDASVASLYAPVTNPVEAANPNAVKVVVDEQGFALYFSRSAIPFARDHASLEAAAENGIQWKRHIGLYAYRVGALREFTRRRPADLESTEKLEQLRFLESGRRIVMAQACREIPAGVDTADDLQRVRDILAPAD